MLPTTTACTFSTSQLPKMVRDRRFLTCFTLKCALRHNGAHFFKISTSQIAPDTPVFDSFDFKMRFALQRHALFQQLNFQKWSENGAFFRTSLCGVLVFDCALPPRPSRPVPPAYSHTTCHHTTCSHAT